LDSCFVLRSLPDRATIDPLNAQDGKNRREVNPVRAIPRSRTEVNRSGTNLAAPLDFGVVGGWCLKHNARVGRTLLRSGILIIVITGTISFLEVRPANPAYLNLEEIPTESPLYRSFEELATRYSFSAAFQQTRPWTIGTGRAYLRDLMSHGCDCESDPAYIRAERELGPDYAGSSRPLLSVAADSSRIEASPSIRLGYTENRTRTPGVIRDYRLGAAFAGGYANRVLLFTEYYAATYSPGPHGNPISGRRFSVIENVDFNLWFDRAYVVVGTNPYQVRVGHTWLRWGPGVTGTLGLYDGSLALDLAEFRYRFANRLQFTWFVAWLDPIAQTYLAGHRLETHLGKRLAIGVSELARFDGSSQVPLYFVPVVGFTQREKQLTHFSPASSDSVERLKLNNVLWTADAVWIPAKHIRLYSELLIDDLSFSSAYRPTEIGYQFGAQFSRPLGHAGAISSNVEFTRIYNFTYSTWHGHNFESDGYPLAYPLGPDVEVMYDATAWNPHPSWTFGLDVSRVRKGEGAIGSPWLPDSGRVENVPLSGTVERTLRGDLSVSYHPSRRLSAGVRIGRSSVRNLDHVPGLHVARFLGSTELSLRF